MHNAKRNKIYKEKEIKDALQFLFLGWN